MKKMLISLLIVVFTVGFIGCTDIKVVDEEVKENQVKENVQVEVQGEVQVKVQVEEANTINKIDAEPYNRVSSTDLPYNLEIQAVDSFLIKVVDDTTNETTYYVVVIQ